MSELNFSDAGPCVPGDGEWERRLNLFMTDPTPMQWCWLSFVDTDKSDPYDEQIPGGGGFIGICIVPGSNVVQAAQIAHALGCNPGGQVGMYPACPPGWTPKPEYACRLFTGDEGRAMGQMELDEFAEPPS